MPKETIRRRRGNGSAAASPMTTASPTASPSATREVPVSDASSSANSSTKAKEPKTIEQVIEEEEKSFTQFLSLCAIVTFVFFYMIKTTVLPPRGRVYAIILDAGSTGTRAQIFQFLHNSTDNKLMLRDTKMHSVKKSIAALGTGMGGTGNQFFKPLLENVKKNVPGIRRRKRTPILLGATAGLRLLGHEASELALKKSRDALNATEFDFEANYVSILDEKDEAIFGWTTVNFLLGKIGSDQPPVATMELGGASMQVVYVPTSEEDTGSKQTTTVKILNDEYKVKPSSYLKLGLLSFKKELLNLFESEGILEDENPCYRRGKTFSNKELKVGVEGSEETKRVNIIGDGDFNRCVASSKIAMDHTLPGDKTIQPLPENTVVYAFAYFYDQIIGHGLPSVPTQKQLWEKGVELCESEERKFTTASSSESSASDEACLEFSYIYTILKAVTEDFSKTRNVQVHFEQYADGHMFGWALGAALNAIEPIMHRQISLDDEPLTL